jgi:hypothetical protein
MGGVRTMAEVEPRYIHACLEQLAQAPLAPGGRPHSTYYLHLCVVKMKARACLYLLSTLDDWTSKSMPMALVVCHTLRAMGDSCGQQNIAAMFSADLKHRMEP